MNYTIGLAGRACTAFAEAGVNLEMINQGSSKVSMKIGINADDIPGSVRALYDQFFGSSA